MRKQESTARGVESTILQRSRGETATTTTSADVQKREPTRVCETFGLCKQLGAFIKRGATRYVTNCLRVAFIAFVPAFLHTDYQVQRDSVLCLHLHETGRPSGVDATVMLGGGNVAKQDTCCDLIMYRGFIQFIFFNIKNASLWHSYVCQQQKNVDMNKNMAFQFHKHIHAILYPASSSSSYVQHPVKTIMRPL